jgi:putative endonuclease
MTMYYVYVLKSIKDGKLYTRKTSNLKRRIREHNSGKVISTKARRPLELVFYEAFLHKTDAGRDEIFFKSGYGREVLKDKLLNSLK